ncbi:endothelial lipase [Drosophila tropicalis]|uniref:endothelial lipase n=1 Tax=Drosophila tropicalis TaxID=46794 RepID=UPI0035AC222D
MCLYLNFKSITMARASSTYCLVPFLCQLWGIHALSLDTLVSQSNIYYQRPAKLGPPVELVLENVDHLESVESIKLIVHGYLGSRTHSSIMPLRNAYAAQAYENILVADWSPVANLDYPSARRSLSRVAHSLANLLQQFIGKHNISHEAVHVIGHSLGAHIAGRIANHFNGTLGRVTGLDPALPLFTPRSDDSLQANAAGFVDIIHTDYPLFGDFTPRGTVDFYPNYGLAPQPGCEDVDLLTASKLILEAYSCSHNRAVLFYAESIGLPKNFPAIRCPLKSIKSRNLNGCLQYQNASIGDMDESQLIYMGEKASKSATSYFVLVTNAAPPFGQGVVLTLS